MYLERMKNFVIEIFPHVLLNQLLIIVELETNWAKFLLIYLPFASANKK